MYAINPQTYPQKLWVSAAAQLTMLTLCLTGIPNVADAAADTSAADYLSLEAVADGKCQILSEGGKLVIMRNTHPDRPIAYRLIRTFAKVPQSRVVGVVEPASDGQRLGCNRVDGRDQSWRIERAAFKEEMP